MFTAQLNLGEWLKLVMSNTKLSMLYYQLYKWLRRLKRDPVHEEVMKALRRFTHEE